MVKEHVLMRKIAAVETLGSCAIICTDKTGTLTEGKMRCVQIHTGAGALVCMTGCELYKCYVKHFAPPPI